MGLWGRMELKAIESKNIWFIFATKANKWAQNILRMG